MAAELRQEGERSMQVRELMQELRAIAGAPFVTADRYATYAYSSDASVFGGTDAEVVVRPGSTDEVSHIMALASRHRIPVVVRGGGSSIYGQPKGRPGRNLLIDMTRMNAVLDLNPENMTVSAQAGIMISKLQQACNRQGLYVFTPAAPVHTVSLGGWLSGAAGGGGIWWETISMTVVLPDGTVVRTGGGPGTNVHQPLFYSRNVGGPDFTGMFTGDGGALGIKTEVTIRLMGLPKVTRASIVECAGLDTALELVLRHVRRVSPHPFDPVLVFGPGAMELFMPGAGGGNIFTAMAMMQGHTAVEMEAKRDAFDAMAAGLGVTRNPALDAMAMAMAGSEDPDTQEEKMEMFGLSFFNGLGLAAWLPFHIPRSVFAGVYPKLIAWREERVAEAARRGYECQGRFEFFTPSDQCSLSGEIDAFFKDTDDPEQHAFVKTMIYDFQRYTHELGLVDVYNQGVMSRMHASCWSPGFAGLYRKVKETLDPNNILNPGLWSDTPPDEAG
jgi:FAD/FMN-containing dehydrogenase